MENSVKAFKAALSAAVSLLTTLWGWFGWLMVGWILCMALDIATGMAAGLRAGEWSSKKAREGLLHKAGCVAAVTAAGVLDLVVGMLTASLPAGTLPFTYTVLICPITTVWYLLAEVGSVIENAGSMGAPVPPWLKKAIAALRDRLEEDT